MFRKYLILMAFVAGCDEGGSKSEGAGGAGGGAPDLGAGGVGGGGGAGGEGTFELVPSRKARVKFKGGERVLGDLAAALELDRDAACTELGLYDCVRQVHRIALGGVEPYVLRINDPLEVIPVTAAIATDRLALTACTQRAEADFGEPGQAKVFKDLATGAADAATLEATVATLYDRLLFRAPSAEELAAVVGLHADVVAEEGGDGRKTFAKLACFAVATTLESLFF